MSISGTELKEAVAQTVSVSDDALTADLADGRTITVPLGWFPRLAHGTSTERDNWRLIAGGEGIHWPDLDEDISVESLLAGRRSGETQESLLRWLQGRESARKEVSGAIDNYANALKLDELIFSISLIPAADDPPLKAPAYQAELQKFEQSLTSKGIIVEEYSICLREGWSAEPSTTTYLGDFAIKVLGTIGPPIIAAIAGWLHGRAGRKVHLKVGEIEVDAPTIKEVEVLLARVQEMRESNEKQKLIP